MKQELAKFCKYSHDENVYLNIYEDGLSLYEGLNKYFFFYNTKRPHQSLKYETPIEVFRNVA